MPEYQKCEAARSMAEEIINRHHPHLEDATIAYILKVSEKPRKKRAMKSVKWASASKPTDKTRAAVADVCGGLYGPDFIIEIQSWVWEELVPEEQRALLDHELMHCKRDVDGYYIADHDVEEFSEIVSRYGAWTPNIKRFFESGQGELFEGGEKLDCELSTPDGRSVKTNLRQMQRATKILKETI